MATYSSKKVLKATTVQIPLIAEAIREDFAKDGFEVYIDSMMSGGRDISITKGNLFKAVLGMRSALKISLTPHQDGVFFDANVGIFGQQAIPTIISMLFFWPVLLTQIWGLIQQSALDDRALKIAEEKIQSLRQITEDGSTMFCTSCGSKMKKTDLVCPICGEKNT